MVWYEIDTVDRGDSGTGHSLVKAGIGLTQKSAEGCKCFELHEELGWKRH